MRLLLLSAISCIAIQSTALAKEPISDEGAAKVKKMVQSVLNEHKQANTSKNSQFITDGSIQVEQAASYYAVTLPDISIIRKREKDGETKSSTTKIGIMGLNISPTDNPKEWSVAIAIPTPLKRLDHNQKPSADISIGSQKMSAIWNEDLKAFSKAKGKYNNIIISKEDGTLQTNINELTINTDVTQSDQNLWSGPSNIQLSGISIQEVKEGEYIPKVEVGKVNITSTVKDYSPYMRDKLSHIMNNVKDNIGDTKDATTQSISAVAPVILPLLDLTDTSALKVTLSDVKVASKANTMTNSPITLKEAFFGFGVHGLKSRMLGHDLNFGWHGLTGKKSALKDDNIIPTTASFSLKLDKLPLDPFITLITQLSSAQSSDNSMAQMATMNTMMSLPQKLSDAGTAVTIQNTKLSHPSYAFDLSGQLKASKDSIFGGNGEATIKSSGIDNVIELLKKQRPGASQRKLIEISHFIRQLTTLKNISVADPNNKGMQTATFILNNKGKVVVNGVPLEQVLANASKQQQQ